MPARSPVRIYCAAVLLAALGVVGLVAPVAHFGWIVTDPIAFVVLATGIMLGELLPIRTPLRGAEDEEYTLSAAFALALLVIGGLGPALIAQSIASAAQDIHSGKPAWRVRFNVGQYILALVASWLVTRAVDASSALPAGHPLRTGQLAGLLVAATVFFGVNRFVVGVAVALYHRVGIRAYFRENVSFGLISGLVILFTAPIVLACAAYSVLLVPLCMLPVVAMYHSLSQTARSEHLALHDSLTGLPNRMALGDALGAALQNPGVPACVLLMDLDRFKEVNDTLGHRYGDLLLTQVAECLRETLGHAGRIARLGGDEFAFVGPGCDATTALDLAHRLTDALRRPFEIEQMVVDAQASVGIAMFPDDGIDMETLLQKADVAMYQAKAARSGAALYDERYDHYTPARLALTAELRTAVVSPELTVHYQPQSDFATGEITALEALVRWDHPRLGTLLPGEFVRIAEQSNLIRPLTQRVLAVALGDAARWRALGFDVSVAVNISPQVLVDRGFTSEVVDALHRVGLPPARLKLEVTESALMSDPETARDVLRELDALGIEIAIDDFGTGYSSLSYLADLPVTEVKIDRSFVSRMSDCSSERIIVSSTIDLAHHLGLRAVAEGVERPEMLAPLRALGCDVVQGHAISPPLPFAEVTRWLRDRAIDGDGDAAIDIDTETGGSALASAEPLGGAVA